MADCSHPSARGIDQTPLDDPAKVWKCDVCKVLHRSITTDGVTVDVPVVIER